ncbi:hypothetical protein GCM10020295_39800 [Streptomyces cinereospinus]
MVTAPRGRVDRVHHGIVQITPYQQVDVAVQGGREQQPLAGGGDLVEQCGHLRHEPHVGHLVGLVQDGDGDLVEPAVAPLDEVPEAAGGRDDDLGAAAQDTGLAVDRQPAHHGGDPQPQGAGVRGERVGDLLGQLPGGDEDQGQRLPGLGPLPVQPAQQRQSEGERLARAGAAPAQDVPAGQRVRQGGRLDREGHLHALGAERGQQPGGQVQLGERLGRGQRLGQGDRQGELPAGPSPGYGGGRRCAGRGSWGNLPRCGVSRNSAQQREAARSFTRMSRKNWVKAGEIRSGSETDERG